ncbi:MAG: hypothetical protein SCH39_02970 [Methanosarcinales archaeon]|nr:hypothetical protein [Methanosarcinales archaeon]
MESESSFVSKCKENLTKYLTDINAKATVNVMEKHQLSSFNDSDTIPQDVIDNCVSILSKRLNMMAGGKSSSLFLNDMKV